MPFNRKNCLAFDVETGSTVNTEYALQPYRAMRNEADITSYATAVWTGAKLEAGAVNRPSREDLAKLVNYIIDNDLTVVGWNVAFDAAWLMGYGLVAEVHKIRWLDGMLLWQHLTREPEYDTTRQKKKSYSLKNAVREFLPKYAGYEEDIDFFDDSPAMVAKRLKYNKLDAAFTLRLTEQFYNTLEKTNPTGLRNALIEASAISSMAESIVNGLVVDAPHAQAMQGRLDQTAAEVGARLAAYGLTPEIIASPKQLTHKLYEEWKLPIYSTTPKGAPSADKVALYLLSAEDERVREITKLREATGNRTKFVDKILASVEYNEDGCTRPWPRIYGTYTGRVTFNSTQGRNKEERQTGFALHQMKRDKEFRKIITVPQGFVLCEWDAAGQEYRWMAIESGDTKMLELCEPGHDPHAYMGAAITHVGYEGLVIAAHAGDPVAKNTRQMGKVGNLSCVAENEWVMTNNGYKPIQMVSLADTVWDGITFVRHDGVVHQGYKHVIEARGLRATSDHLVLTESGAWVPFGEAVSTHAPIQASSAWGPKVDRSAPTQTDLVPVYDILNCGPRNRFVANGLIIHNCQYRISDKKLWETANVNFGLSITKPEATKILLTYHRTYPGVEQYWRRKIMEARRRGYAETLAGRRVQLTGSWTNRQTSWQLESTAVNFPIQGVGADQKYLAIKVLRHYLNQYGGRFYFELHDGLYAILPVATAPSAARVIQRALNRLPYSKAWGFSPPIPLPWDLKMGANWGEMTEVTDD